MVLNFDTVMVLMIIRFGHVENYESTMFKQSCKLKQISERWRPAWVVTLLARLHCEQLTDTVEITSQIVRGVQHIVSP